MSSPNLNIVTLLGSGLAYTSAYLFGIQEQSLPSRDSVEKLIQVSGGFAGSGACTHANVCRYMRVCTSFLLATAFHHPTGGCVHLGCDFHIHKVQPGAFHLSSLC